MRMMNLIFLLILSVNAVAQDTASKVEKETDEATVYRQVRERISERYFKGSTLIYDCKERHYVCVDRLSAEDCHRWRDEALRKNRFSLECAPLKEFKTNQECVQDQYQRVHDSISKAWCYNDRKLRF